MALSIWQRGDSLPALPQLDGFRADISRDEQLLAALCRLDKAEIRRRFDAGHRPFVGHLKETAVAYGWLAAQEAAIGELGLAFRLPPGHRYLWDFATLPAWRGQGIYPHLLQAILRQEMAATTFWIIRAPENGASGSGIRKAGFTAVGRLSLLGNGRAGLAPFIDRERAQLGAALLGVPLVETNLFLCWHCGGAAYPPSPHVASCACRQDESCACAA